MGMNLQIVYWIMRCLSSTSFVVLINGSPSGFFNASRGLLQGCPLSPFLFLLIVEGLSMLIKDARRRGILKGIKKIESVVVTHLLFVLDIIIFYQGTTMELRSIKEILDIYCQAIGMEVNMVKSSKLFNELEDEIKTQIKYLFPINYSDLDQGIKYLGFKLEPNDYKYADWIWLHNKIEARSQYGATCGYHGVVVLYWLEAVLESIRVYWKPIAHS
jgi:hypothetical protein